MVSDSSVLNSDDAAGGPATPDAAPFIAHPKRVIAAAVIFGCIPLMAIGTAPIGLAALAQAGVLSNQTMGQISTLELLGVAVGSVFGPRFLRRGGFRMKLVAALIGILTVNLACMTPVSEPVLASLRAICGLLEGTVLGGAILILTYVRNPERMNGFFLALTTAPQVVASYVLSSYAMARFGSAAWFELMAAAAAVGVITSLSIPSVIVPKPGAAGAVRVNWTGPAILAALTMLLQNAAIGAAFGYIVQIASEHAIDGVIIGLSISALQIAAMVSAFVVGLFGWRLSHSPVLVIGCLFQALAGLAFGGLHHPMAYLAICALFGFSWNALLPFSLKLLIEIDPSRQLAMLNSPLALTGLALGPFLASLVVTNVNVQPAFALAAAMFAASSALYLGAHILGARRKEASAAAVHAAPP